MYEPLTLDCPYEKFVQSFQGGFLFCTPVFGPKYSAKKETLHIYEPFIWLGKVGYLTHSSGCVELVLVLERISKSRLKVEFGHYEEMEYGYEFKCIWAVEEALCSW